MLTIGTVAKETGIGIETIRFYERKGLIKPPPRNASGYRQYSKDVIKRIRFIKNAKELGFSLKEISELLSLRLTSRSKCSQVRKNTSDKISEVERKIETLQKMRKALKKLLLACDTNTRSADCPILKALEQTRRAN